MKKENVNIAEPMNGGEALPANLSPWTKMKKFLFQEIKVELTPKQEKVFKEVHDFWHQEITGEDVHDFLFQEITLKDVKDFWLQKIEITL